MDILKLNKIVIVGFIICFFSCEEIHKKPKGYCNKYISGGMGMNFSLNGDIKNNELKSINIKSKINGNLNYFKKITKVKQLVIGDS
ncbi:hypothetical protein, partial [Tenacibaculum ovolyticum]|uniref:hypothetical protein n=1 Tax=Tenacibaculum ovolyticum TaxID=104270 RepID=UPI000AAE0D97